MGEMMLEMILATSTLASWAAVVLLWRKLRATKTQVMFYRGVYLRFGNKLGKLREKAEATVASLLQANRAHQKMVEELTIERDKAIKCLKAKEVPVNNIYHIPKPKGSIPNVMKEDE